MKPWTLDVARTLDLANYLPDPVKENVGPRPIGSSRVQRTGHATPREGSINMHPTHRRILHGKRIFYNA